MSRYTFPIQYTPNPQPPFDYSAKYAIQLADGQYLCRKADNREEFEPGPVENAYYQAAYANVSYLQYSHKGSKVVRLDQLEGNK